MDQPRLCDLKCKPCEGGIPPLTPEQIVPLTAQIPEWKLAGDALSVSRELKFRDFKEAMAFVNRAADVAEREGHHPDMLIRWNRVLFTLSTHAIKGLSENDFVLAAKIDALLA